MRGIPFCAAAVFPDMYRSMKVKETYIFVAKFCQLRFFSDKPRKV